MQHEYSPSFSPAASSSRTPRVIVRLAYGSLAVGVGVLALKYVAYLMTGSVALYSDALESIVNVAAALAAILAVTVSAKPADEGHPWGHHKVEYFAAGLEGALIMLAALLIIHEAVLALFVPRVLDLDIAGLAVNALAGVLNAAWSRVLVRQGKKLHSPALIADGRHLWADVVSSIGVLTGVGLAMATGWSILDPLLALAVAAHILWSGFGLVRESMGALMDEAAGPEVAELVRRAVADKAPEALEVHQIRTRRAGPVVFVDFHLVVPGEMTVAHSHAMCDSVEERLREELPGGQVTIHVEPEHEAVG